MGPPWKVAATIQIVIVDEHAVLGVTGSQASEYGSMTTFGTLHAQTMIVQQLMQHLGEALIFFQRAERPAMKLLYACLDGSTYLLLKAADLFTKSMQLIDRLSNRGGRQGHALLQPAMNPFTN